MTPTSSDARRSRRARRWHSLCRLGLWVTLGLVITVGLTVARSLLSPRAFEQLGGQGGYTTVGGSTVGYIWFRDLGLDFAQTYPMERGPDHQNTFLPYRELDDLPFSPALLTLGGPSRERYIVACGIPCRAFVTYFAVDDAAPNWIGGYALTPWTDAQWVQWPRCIPLRPMWPGLLINVATWSAAAAAPFVHWSRIVTSSRARRGQCVTCAYPRPAGATRCPECGVEFPGQKQGA